MVSKLSVFFPAYNEEENLRDTISPAVRVLEALNLEDYEVLIINDHSRDKTQEVAEGLAKEFIQVRVVENPQNLGYGGVLKVGFANSKFEWVAFADSDGQFDFGEITKFIDKSDGADLVLGYRLNRADSFSRKILTFGWSMLARILLGLDVRDYSCGFKMIKLEVYKAVQPLRGEEKVTQIEMFVKAKRLGFKFAEVGVHHYPRKYGKPTGANIKVVIKSLGDLFGLWWELRK